MKKEQKKIMQRNEIEIEKKPRNIRRGVGQSQTISCLNDMNSIARCVS